MIKKLWFIVAIAVFNSLMLGLLVPALISAPNDFAVACGFAVLFLVVPTVDLHLIKLFEKLIKKTGEQK